MPTFRAKRLVSAASGCGLVVALGLAIGCTSDPAPGSGPDHRSMAMPTESPSTQPTPGATASPDGGSQQTASISFSSQVAPLLQNRCSSCHGTPQVGGPSLFDSSGNARYTNIKSSLEQIISEVSSGAMPRNGDRLTQSQVELLESWQVQGAPDN